MIVCISILVAIVVLQGSLLVWVVVTLPKEIFRLKKIIEVAKALKAATVEGRFITEQEDLDLDIYDKALEMAEEIGI